MAGEARLLIVDDDPQLRELLERHFAEQYAPRGCVVETAEDGIAALEAIHRHPPTLVILDADMPRMGGVELLEHIRGMEPRIRVIMLTGSADARLPGHVLAAGAESYAPKPLSLTYLDHLVDLFLHDTSRRPYDL
jgi:DNA-binding response OmpR family regulator